MDIKRGIKYALHALCFDKPRKHQVSPIRSLTGGQDTIVIAGTSSGKTAIYQAAGLMIAREQGGLGFRTQSKVLIKLE